MSRDKIKSKNPIFWPFGSQRVVLRAFRAAIGKTAVLLPASFLAATGLGVNALGLIFFMQGHHNVQAAGLGFFTALYSLSYITGCFVLRPLTKKMLPRFSMLLASSLMVLWASGMLLVKSIPLIFIFYSLYGFSNSLFWPPLMGWLSAGIEGPALNKTISRWNLSWSLGTIISPFITGLLAEKNLFYPLYLGITLFISVSLLITVASYSLRRIRIDIHREEKAPKHTLKEKDKSTYLRFPGWIGIFSAYILLGIMSNIFPIYARESLSLPESRIGVVLLMRALFSSAGFILTGKTKFWQFKGRFILANQIILALILLILIPLNSFSSYLIVMPLLGLLSAFIYTNAMFHGVSGSVERSKRMSIHEAILTCGVVLGSLLGGNIYHHFSMRLVYALCIFLICLGFAVQIYFVWDNKSKREKGLS